jgi:hypothetical protein
MTLGGEGSGIVRQLDAETTSGVARAAFGLEEPGLLEINASSEQARLSEVLQLDVSQTGAVAVTVVAPVLTPPGDELAVPAGSPPEPGLISRAGYPGFDAWLLSMMFLVGSAWAAYRVAHRGRPRRAGILPALGTAVGGLLAFDYVVLGLPGALTWASTTGLPGLLGAILAGELLGFLFVSLWLRRVRAT